MLYIQRGDFMKKIISILLIILMLFCCFGCKEKNADSLSKNDRKALHTLATDVVPSVTFVKPITDSTLYTQCFVAIDTVAHEVIELLASFEYTGEQCACVAEHYIYIGKSNEFKFGIKFDRDNKVESVEYGAKAYIPTTEQAEKLLSLLQKIAVKENYRTVAGLENNVSLIKRKDNSFCWYSFKNSDADRLTQILSSISLTDALMTNGIEYRIEGMGIRIALNCQKPFVSSHEKSAYLTESQATEIKSILERNCTKQNEQDNPDGKLPVFVKDLIDGDKIYSFTNEFSAFLIDYLSLSGIYNSNESCNCEKQYRIYSFDDYYKDDLKTDYYISFAGGIAHLKNNNGFHLVLSKRDSEYIKQMIDALCTEQNLAK